jgi:ABC-2 type transport system permease protein
MSTITATPLHAPIPADVAGVHRRPGLGRLVGIELRKILDTRAGFWMQVATVALTALVVIVRSATGDAADHTFAALLDVGVKPAAVLLPIAGILLVTSEWSQRTGMITFTLVPVRFRVLGAKLVASLVLAFALLAVSVAIVAAGVVVAGPGAEGAWSDAPALIGQSAVYLGGGMLTGVAFGMVVLASAPAIVALFALPIAWTAVASLSVFADAAPWLDTRLALGPLPQEVATPTQWAHAATALALWMALPLLIGTWRITRREVAA